MLVSFVSTSLVSIPIEFKTVSSCKLCRAGALATLSKSPNVLSEYEPSVKPANVLPPSEYIAVSLVRLSLVRLSFVGTSFVGTSFVGTSFVGTSLDTLLLTCSGKLSNSANDKSLTSLKLSDKVPPCASNPESFDNNSDVVDMDAVVAVDVVDVVDVLEVADAVDLGSVD